MTKKFILSILFSFIVFIINDKSFSNESNPGILIGFADTGFWYKKGTIYLQIPPIKNAEDLIALKYQDRISKEKYIEMSYEEARNSFNFQREVQFQVYSKDGYLGNYSINTFVILVNGCTGEYFYYIKLNGKINLADDKGMNVIAKIINKNQKANVSKTIKEIKLTESEKTKIENILSKKIEHIRKNEFPQALKDIEKSRKQNLEFRLNYQVFKITDIAKKQDEFIVNATWHCDDGALMSDTGYCLNGIFLISNEVIDLKQMIFTEGENLNIPTIEFGIDTELNNKFQWIIDYKYWEGAQSNFVKFNNGKQEIRIEGNIFGC